MTFINLYRKWRSKQLVQIKMKSLFVSHVLRLKHKASSRTVNLSTYFVFEVRKCRSVCYQNLNLHNTETLNSPKLFYIFLLDKFKQKTFACNFNRSTLSYINFISFDFRQSSILFLFNRRDECWICAGGKIFVRASVFNLCPSAVNFTHMHSSLQNKIIITLPVTEAYEPASFPSRYILGLLFIVKMAVESRLTRWWGHNVWFTSLPSNQPGSSCVLLPGFWIIHLYLRLQVTIETVLMLYCYVKWFTGETLDEVQHSVCFSSVVGYIIHCRSLRGWWYDDGHKTTNVNYFLIIS